LSDLNNLLPFGLLATRRWLLSKGVSQHLLDNKLKSSQFVALARGVFARKGVPVGWQGLLASLNRESNIPVYVGGLSALEISGLAHYVSMRQSYCFYSSNKQPSWLARLDTDFNLQWFSTKRLWNDALFNVDRTLTEIVWQSNLPPYKQACPEQAYFEILFNLPDLISFEHADQLMQGLVNLSPRKLDLLLKHCNSIRVKRLFFWYAKRHNHSWFSKLNSLDYDLGSGKRVIAKSGKLDNEFLITVPKEMAL